jgi:hypothetical protein
MIGHFQRYFHGREIPGNVLIQQEWFSPQSGEKLRIINAEMRTLTPRIEVLILLPPKAIRI